MNTRRPFFPVLVSALALAAPAVATAQTGGSRVFGDLLKRIPEQTNALMFVNVDGLYDSPIGRRENWRQRAQENRRDRLGLAAEYSKAAVAVGMDFQSLEEHWKVGMIQLRSTPPKLENLAAREGGYVETIENMPVAWTPRGFDLFVFPDNILGFVSPTDRQGIVSWIRSTLSHPRTFPPGFADRAIFRADSGAQVVLAFNLADSVSAKMIEPWLNAIESIKKSHTDAKLLAPRLASVKSASLVVTADQDIQGSLRFDFERPVDYTAPVARELILTLLEDCGADLPELKTWTLGFDKKSPAVEMSGRLSVESLRKILSVAQPPELSPESRSTATASASDSTPTPAPASSRNDGLAASQGYFRSVTSLMDGLKKTDRPTYQSTKLWYDRYAKRIEELPILNVDKELLDWGGAVARTLREMSSGVNYYSQNQKYSLATSSNGYYGGYNGYYVNSRSYDQAVIKRQSDAKMSVDLDARWQALETSVADMRRKMVEKYMVDF